MDITGIAAVDVFIGLAFLYFLLSTACSAINEGLASSLNWRAKDLESGILKIFGDDPDSKVVDANQETAQAGDRIDMLADRVALLARVTAGGRDIGPIPAARQVPPAPVPQISHTEAFYLNERVQTLSKPKRFLENAPIVGRFLNDKKPSYIPPRVFAQTVLDTYALPEPAEDRRELSAQLNRGMAAPNSRIAKLLQDAVDEGNRVPKEKYAETVQVALERSFDETMERVTGWYKRRTQFVIFVIALVVVGAINADSFAIGERLFKDDALRASVVAQATKAVDEGTATCIKVTPAARVTPEPVPAPNETAAKCLDRVFELGLPLGWSTKTMPNDWGILGKIAGLLVTVFLVLLGAPFWFDLLSKVANLRGAGEKPKTTSTNSTTT